MVIAYYCKDEKDYVKNMLDIMDIFNLGFDEVTIDFKIIGCNNENDYECRDCPYYDDCQFPDALKRGFVFNLDDDLYPCILIYDERDRREPVTLNSIKDLKYNTKYGLKDRME